MGRATPLCIDYEFSKVLGGEFVPYTDPLRGKHTLAELARASFSAIRAEVPHSGSRGIRTLRVFTPDWAPHVDVATGWEVSDGRNSTFGPGSFVLHSLFLVDQRGNTLGIRYGAPGTYDQSSPSVVIKAGLAEGYGPGMQPKTYSMPIGSPEQIALVGTTIAVGAQELFDRSLEALPRP